MLASASRRPQILRLPYFFPWTSQARGYAQQKSPRVPNAAPMRTTTNPAPTTQSKNRNVSPFDASGKSRDKAIPPSGVNAKNVVAPVRGMDGQEFEEVRQKEIARGMEERGEHLTMMRISGAEPWSQKISLLGASFIHFPPPFI